MDILTETMILLKESKQKRREIASGAGVGFEWLAKLAQERIPDPGIIRVQKLHKYLKNNEQSAA